MVLDRAHAYRANECRALRKAMALEIMREVESKGGKFLKPLDTANANKGTLAGAWEVVPQTTALVKVRQTLTDTSAPMPETQTPTSKDSSAAGAFSLSAAEPAFVPYRHSDVQQQTNRQPYASGQVTTMHQAALSQNSLQGDYQGGLAIPPLRTMEQRSTTEALLLQHWQQQQNVALLVSLLTQQQVPYPALGASGRSAIGGWMPSAGGGLQTATSTLPFVEGTTGMSLPIGTVPTSAPAGTLAMSASHVFQQRFFQPVTDSVATASYETTESSKQRTKPNASSSGDDESCHKMASSNSAESTDRDCQSSNANDSTDSDDCI